MNRGYFFIAFGPRYIEEACNLVRLLRKFGDNYPASILCAAEEIEVIKSKNLFDKIIPFNFDNDFSKLDKTSFEKFGGTPKILMPEYLPYDETIYTDTDVLVQCNPVNVWNHFKDFNQPVVCTSAAPNIHDLLNINISNHLQKNISDVMQTHTGIVYFNKKNDKFDLFSEYLKYFWKNYSAYGLDVREFRGGKVDEHAFLAAVNKLDLKSASGATYPIMTHNYHYDIELPSNKITNGTMYNFMGELDSPPPFIHMFKENVRDYIILYIRLMNL